MTTETPTLDQVLTLARRLRPADQVRLVAHLTPALAAASRETQPGATSGEDPWETLAQLREAFRAQGPVTPSVTEELLASRR